MIGSRDNWWVRSMRADCNRFARAFGDAVLARCPEFGDAVRDVRLKFDENDGVLRMEFDICERHNALWRTAQFKEVVYDPDDTVMGTIWRLMDVLGLDRQESERLLVEKKNPVPVRGQERRRAAEISKSVRRMISCKESHFPTRLDGTRWRAT